jgi:hypothetical protein
MEIENSLDNQPARDAFAPHEDAFELWIRSYTIHLVEVGYGHNPPEEMVEFDHVQITYGVLLLTPSLPMLTCCL